MASSLATLAELVGGTVVGPTAAELLQLHAAATLDAAQPGEISLLDSAAKAGRLARSRASAVVVPRGFHVGEMPMLQVDNVHAAFAMIVAHFRPHAFHGAGVSPQAIVSATAARLGRGNTSRCNDRRRCADWRRFDHSFRSPDRGRLQAGRAGHDLRQRGAL